MDRKILAAAIVLCLCACDGDANPGANGADAALTGDAAALSGERWEAGDYPAALDEQEYLEISGVDGQESVRGYKVRVPEGIGDEPVPLVFVLHGRTQNPVSFAISSAKWPEKSDDEGFVLVMPTGNVKDANGDWGVAGSWNGGGCCGEAVTEAFDDVALVRAIFEEVASHVNIDPGRVYATGLSNGAYLSYRLACEASDLFVAVAPAAGAIGNAVLDPEGDVEPGTQPNDFADCNPKHPVAVLATHGTADSLIDYAKMKPSLDHMAEANGCGMKTKAANLPESGGDTTCVTYRGCPRGVEVTGCTVEGGGHCWFGAEDCGAGAESFAEDLGLGGFEAISNAIGGAVVGQNSDTLVNTDVIWDFFSRISR